MAIVLPNSILGNPGTEYIRWWIMKNTWVLASVDLPIEVFVVEANVNILTSVLFLKKKTDKEKTAEGLGGTVDYPIFMAVAEKVGFDRRGNTLYKRRPDGEDIVKMETEVEKVLVNGKAVKRTIRRPTKIVDDDLPEIVKEYRGFIKQHAKDYPHLQSL
jgi:type I restriction enzyme M protein